MNIDELIQIRKYLHQNPELSHHEKETSAFINDEIQKTRPSSIIKQDKGNGLLVNYDRGKTGSKIAFRTDIDALPIQEINAFEYRSLRDGVSHKCGHDGHMASMIGFAHNLHSMQKGAVQLVFQPAEETGEGAAQLLNDPAMTGFDPDMVYAYHNLPGFPIGSIIVGDGVFTAASVGVTIKLHGKTSHAGRPENGISPALAVSDLIRGIEELSKSNDFKDFTLTTVIHAVLGEIAFGTAPGYAEVRATLRSYKNADLDLLKKKTEHLINQVENDYALRTEISYSEYFPATENNQKCVDIIRKAAENIGAEVVEQGLPFRWSEDFAHFTLKSNGAMFGIGSGIDHPQLHNPDYDFPDEIIPIAIDMYKEIYKLSVEEIKTVQ